MEIYDTLLNHFGPQDWWPGDSDFEIVVGAILTQQASWRNAEKAIENLKAAGALGPEKIVDLKQEELEGLIRPSGFYRQKARYLKAFCGHLVDGYQGNLANMLLKELKDLRTELQNLDGIGPETCDSILLYAGNRLTFVVDAYTVRICGRTGLIDSAKYDIVKSYFEEHTAPDVKIYNEFHALLVELGKNFCKSSNPECGICPISALCGHASKD